MNFQKIHHCKQLLHELDSCGGLEGNEESSVAFSTKMLDSSMKYCKQFVNNSSCQLINVVLQLAYLYKVNTHSFHNHERCGLLLLCFPVYQSM